jgi:hypothetical protein
MTEGMMRLAWMRLNGYGCNGSEWESLQPPSESLEDRFNLI